jgi:hypothetical protein
MTNIDKTNGAGSTNTTSRTNQTDSTDGSDDTAKSARGDGGRQVDTAQTASTKTPPRPETVDRFKQGFLRQKPGGGPQPGDGGGGVEKAAVLQAHQQHRDQQMEQRKEKLGKALDKQYETMGIDWDADEGFWDKPEEAWKQDYERQAFSSDKWKNSRETLEKSLYQNGRPMRDTDIEEAVDKHKQRLEKRDAFEGFSSDDIQNWENGLTDHLKQQRAEQQVRVSATDSVEELPTPSRDLDERGVDNPDQLRQKLDAWESKQLEELDKIADENGLERPQNWNDSANIPDDTVYTEKRERIQEARNTYEKLMVGDEHGTQYAYPEEVDSDLTVGEGRPRDAYIRHLEENPGDIMGAYRAAEERIKPDQRDKLPDMLANAAS